ncbi:peptidoglycan-binding protein [Streptomyces sp. WG5]|uniref:peptidoglycan-binding protein n=1 Tax=Streptomyces sp. WG5 TaxID=3417648 RepID=UPI003CF58317
MATPMTPSQIKSQLKKWGVPFKEYRDWSNHNRNHKGAWGPVNGFMVHHTGSDAKDQRALLYNGYSSLPGPLCHFGLAQDGTVHLIGWGRANHAGMGDDDVLDAVIDERPAPVDNESNTDFNARFYGVEIWYSGSHAMTDAQYKTLLNLASAVLDFHGWNEYSVIGHGESGSPGKWDPGYKPGHMMDMDDVREDIEATLAGKPKPTNPQKPSAPKPTGSTYTVLAGDSLSRIGKKLGIDWGDLAKANSLKAPYVIHPGDKLKVPAKSKPTPKPKSVSYEPYPGAAYFKRAPKADLVERMGKRLVQEGCSAYRVGPGKQWTESDRKSYRKWQLKLGYRGSDADGWPGKTSWDRLKVPKA